MKWEVYVRGSDYTKQTVNLKLERKRSHLYSATGKILGFSETEYNAITKSDEITIRSAKSPRNNFQGEFARLAYDALMQTLSFTAYNFPAKLQNVVWTDDAKEWTDTSFETIITYILDKFDWDDLWWTISDNALKNLVIGFRIEHEPIWKAITRLLKQVGATWYAHPDPWSVSQKKFTQEKLYFDYDFYSSTEEISSYVERALTKQYDKVINYAKILGSGDGTAQLSSTNLHATTIRSHLAAALTADGTTITLDDASDFPETSFYPIQIGAEKILYFSKTDNTLNGCIRAVDDTTAYAHSKGIEVYSAAYDSDSPQVGSSIKDNNLASATLTDKTISDQNTLDFLAQDVIDKYYELKEIVKLETVHVDDLDLTVGDKFTVEGVTDTIYEFLYQDSDLLITLTAGDTYEPFVDEITDAMKSIFIHEEYSEFEDLYAQVGTVTAIDGTTATVLLDSGETVEARLINQ